MACRGNGGYLGFKFLAWRSSRFPWYRERLFHFLALTVRSITAIITRTNVSNCVQVTMATSVDMTQRAFAVAFDNLAILRALLQKAEWRIQLATWIIVKYSLSRATMQEKAVAAATATAPRID